MTEKGAEKELENLISEYLTSRGFLQTVASFWTESRRRPKLATPTQTTDLQDQFLLAYENGEREQFFKLWNQNVQREVLTGNRSCHDLEFNISIYFAVYPIRTGRGDRNHSLQEFTNYLSARKTVLSENPELSVYCALPYVPDLQSHPVFKQLFTELWNSELKSRLVHFLKLSLTQSQPKLLSLYLSNKVNLTTAGSAQEVIVLREELKECQKLHFQKITEIQDSYHTLVGIALELLDALESAIGGKQVTPESIQSICSRLFGGTLSLTDTVAGGNMRPGTATSILRQSVISMRDNIQVPATLHTSTPIPESLSSDHTLTSPPTPNLTMSSETTPTPRSQLDYQQLKNDLISGNEMKTVLLLQALRWRLTRAPSIDISHERLKEYISNDLLGCSDPTNSYHMKMVAMLESSSVISEQLCRLLNAVSSISSGRSYLSHSSHLVSCLCHLLVSGHRHREREEEDEEEEEECSVKNALGAIQKLSLKRHLQGLMVESGILQWVASVLMSEETPSDYILRYCLALLMNLALRSAGKWACLEVGSSLLRSLGDLLEHEDEEICSYVNGILYSLLSLPQLKQEAKTMGMGDMLMSALEASQPQLKSQIHYIISRLESDSPETDQSDSSDDEEEEDDDDGDVVEGDEDEVTIATTGPVGESLLIEYEMKSRDGGKRKKRQDVEEAPFKRPVTPQHTSRPISKAKPAGIAGELEYSGGGGGGRGSRASARSK